MVDRRFFTNHGPFTAADIAAATGASLVGGGDGNLSLVDVAPLDTATARDLSFFDNPKYLSQFSASQAGACFVKEKYVAMAPAGMQLLVSADPYRCYALAAQKFYPTDKPAAGIAPTATIHPTASIAHGVTIAPGAVVGANASIGSRSRIGANTIVGDGVSIGEDTAIGALCSITHSLIGDRVIIHRGVHIGQDGFGFALGREGHVKVPQLGRVVIGNDIEIGSGTTIDRGTGTDTMIGDGTKIDNLVQIGHNVNIGKRAVIVSQVGISGSTHIGEGAVIGGQVGIAGHLKIGAGAKIAAQSGVMTDIPSGASYGGSPAVPSMEWRRQIIALTRLIKSKRGDHE